MTTPAEKAEAERLAMITLGESILDGTAPREYLRAPAPDPWLDPEAAVEAAQPFMQQCGPCDLGLPMGCSCPEGDPRLIMSRLVAVIEKLAAK